jgi:hypothetical protein
MSVFNGGNIGESIMNAASNLFAGSPTANAPVAEQATVTPPTTPEMASVAAASAGEGPNAPSPGQIEGMIDSSSGSPTVAPPALKEHDASSLSTSIDGASSGLKIEGTVSIESLLSTAKAGGEGQVTQARDAINNARVLPEPSVFGVS